MKKSLISIAIASVMAASSGQLYAAQDEQEVTMESEQYQAMGIGAVTGALIAGPAGLVIGGLVGSVYSAQENHQESNVQSQESALYTASATEDMAVDMMFEAHDKHLEATAQVATIEMPEPLTAESEIEDKESPESDSVMVASSTTDNSFNYAKQQEDSNRIKEIITYDLSMELYFKPGSVSVEPFYGQQLAGLLNLMEAMPELQLNLDGYSDRQGSQVDNIQLSTERLDSVRDYFVNKGVDVNRINLQAHGEKNFQSQPGDLDSYIFDRRVVVSFDLSLSASSNAVAGFSNDSYGSFGSIGSSSTQYIQ